MFLLHGCPRCSGDLAREFDDELSCLQCGNVLLLRPRQRMTRMRSKQRDRAPTAFAASVTASAQRPAYAHTPRIS